MAVITSTSPFTVTFKGLLLFWCISNLLYTQQISNLFFNQQLQIDIVKANNWGKNKMGSSQKKGVNIFVDVLFMV